MFDEHEISFVSVKQSFNTTSSTGRLTRNVLLPFAQFEREVIGERVRDKIATSKRKGIWVGGPVPLGYRSVDKKLEIVSEEAHLLKNRFYVGEVVYRGEAHKGEHEPILDLGLFEAVRQRLRDRRIERSKLRLSSPSLLAGKMFDDRDNPMTPTHANKQAYAIATISHTRCFEGAKTTRDPRRAFQPRMSNNK